MTLAHPFSLEGKTALVAGASRGIGLAIARGVAAAGARTILAARSLDALERNAEAIREEGGHAEAVALDVGDPASISAVVEALPEIDILINVAGTNKRKAFETYTREEYNRLMEVNLHGLVDLTQRVGGQMVKRGEGGRIITVGSLMTGYGLPYVTVYAMTKSALGGMTRSLAAEWGKHEITVNCIAPGFVETDLNREMWKDPTLRAWLPSSQALPRMGTEEEVASLAVYLSSKGAEFITGQVIYVDGGHSTTSIWPFEP
jgi:gluconate 5-dehydrogenase